MAREGLPPGPSAPKLVQALAYTFRSPGWLVEQRGRHGDPWTLRLPSLQTSVLTADRDAIRRLLTGPALERRHANDPLRLALGENSVMLLEPAGHLARRKLLLPPFHGERVAACREVVERLVAAELDRWAADGRLRVHPRAQVLTLEVILQLVLGVRDRTVRDELAGLFEGMQARRNQFGMFAPSLARRARWNVGAAGFYRRRDRTDALLLAHARAARDDPRLEEREDVLALLLLARDEAGEGLGDQELADELFTLVLAGHETTATAISWGLDLLARDPELHARAREAADSGDAAWITALAKEVLRVRTITPVSAGRHVLEPFEVRGWTIPPEVSVLVDAWSLHRDPEVFPDPEAVRPERFLEGDLPPYAYLPFGGGAHRCLGSSLAMLELETVLAAAARRLDLAPAGPPPGFVRRGPTLGPAGGVPLRVRARARAAA